MSKNVSGGAQHRHLARGGVVGALIALYSSWKTLALNAALFVAYYLFIYYVILYSNFGFFLLTIPLSLLILLVLASSALATIAISYIRSTLRRRGVLGVAQSPAGMALGALAASCACSLPLVAPVLYFVGLNAIQVSGVISFFASYQQNLVEAVIVLDVLSAYYYLRLIAKSGGIR
ncbi:MAG: hypothetical protein OK454_11275 [Thaumarchaeota archaeon]|nr:hypothetical protein [Nitrososphaerota archaeon]